MKKNSIIKTLMKVFALFASISGIVFLFRDKILSCPKIKSYAEAHPNCPFFAKLTSLQNQTETPNNTFDEDDAFEHAFDEDPATSREYVSLNINPHRETITSEQSQTES